MATLSISVPKLHCERKTDLFGADEVYVAVIVTTGKLIDLQSENGSLLNIAYAGVSPINRGFRRSTIKEVVLTEDNGKSISVDLGDAEVFSVAFGLYEKDSGELYESLKENLTELPDIENPTFIGFIQNLLSNIEDISVIDVHKVLLGAVSWIFRSLRRDDIIGSDSFSYHVNDPDIVFPREFQGLRGMGGKYNIQFALEIE